MKKKLTFLALAVIGLASCNSGYKKDETGLLYKIYTDKPGPKINEGDFISAGVIMKNDADSVQFSTYEAGFPQQLRLSKSKYKGDIVAGMKLLTEGDSASFKLPVDSILKNTPRAALFKNKFVTYDIKIEKVIPRGTMTTQEFQAAINKYNMELALAVKNAEPGKIKKYITDKKLNVTKTDSDLYYAITIKGKGPLARPGDTVVIDYTGYFLNGKIFDTSIYGNAVKGKIVNPKREYDPIGIPVGEKKVIAGWNQGLLLLNKATRATFIIPSKLAYGEQGTNGIAPYTPLVYDIWVANIIHPTPGTQKK